MSLRIHRIARLGFSECFFSPPFSPKIGQDHAHGALRNTARKRIRVADAQLTSSLKFSLNILFFTLGNMLALVALLSAFVLSVQASSEHGTSTATAAAATPTQNWSPKKPYAEPAAFPQVPLLDLSFGSAGSLFERQAECSSTSGERYACPGNATCVRLVKICSKYRN